MNFKHQSSIFFNNFRQQINNAPIKSKNKFDLDNINVSDKIFKSKRPPTSISLYYENDLMGLDDEPQCERRVWLCVLNLDTGNTECLEVPYFEGIGTYYDSQEECEDNCLSEQLNCSIIIKDRNTSNPGSDEQTNESWGEYDSGISWWKRTTDNIEDMIQISRPIRNGDMWQSYAIVRSRNTDTDETTTCYYPDSNLNGEFASQGILWSIDDGSIWLTNGPKCYGKDSTLSIVENVRLECTPNPCVTNYKNCIARLNGELPTEICGGGGDDPGRFWTIVQGPIEYKIYISPAWTAADPYQMNCSEVLVYVRGQHLGDWRIKTYQISATEVYDENGDLSSLTWTNEDWSPQQGHTCGGGPDTEWPECEGEDCENLFSPSDLELSITFTCEDMVTPTPMPE